LERFDRRDDIDGLQLLRESFQNAGVPLTHVAYKGGAPAAQDLIGGQIPLMVDTASETVPDVPTLKELGINMTADAFFGLYGPAGMAPDIVARVDRAVADALRAPEVQEKIYGFGLVPSHSSAAELASTQAAHLKRWEAPIKASGFKAE
jgi:tripartite-type tricarboxylate transporter receptor subunit TctC